MEIAGTALDSAAAVEYAASLRASGLFSSVRLLSVTGGASQEEAGVEAADPSAESAGVGIAIRAKVAERMEQAVEP